MANALWFCTAEIEKRTVRSIAPSDKEVSMVEDDKVVNIMDVRECELQSAGVGKQHVREKRLLKTSLSKQGEGFYICESYSWCRGVGIHEGNGELLGPIADKQRGERGIALKGMQ